MPKEKIEGLISQLHERIADSDTSPQQEQMLAQLQSQLEEWEGPQPPSGDIRETAEMLLEELEEDHPTASHILSEILHTLTNIGV